MKLRNAAFAALLVIGLGQTAGAFAQTKVFVIDEEHIKRDSKIGKDIAAKLGAIRDDGVTKLGLKSLGDEIKTEQDALKPQTASLSKDALDKNPTLKARVDALGKKQSEFLQKSDYLNQNLEQQQNAAMVAFAAALEPAVKYVAKEAAADVVLSSTSTWFVKDQIDLSTKVIARLDATTPSLESLQQTAAANAPKAPAGAPAPAPQ